MRRTHLLLLFLPIAACFPQPPAEETFLPRAEYPGQAFRSGDWSLELPLGLDPEAAYVPENNPMSLAKIELGRQLYFDTRLSLDDTVSCASCHLPLAGGTDNLPFSPGVGGVLGGRSAPTVLNRLFSRAQFWDGRATSLEEQAIGPIANPVEMNLPHDQAVARLQAIAGYRSLFAAAFDSDEVTITRVGQAIATYERTLLTGGSRYDRFQAGDTTALSDSEQRGMRLFNGKARCNLCHRGANFTGEDYTNLGVGMTATTAADLGRYEVTRRDEDRGAFKVPTLRNIAQTAPYMHDGSAANLLEVMLYYEQGGTANVHLHPDVQPLDLDANERHDVINFMLALTGEIINAEPPRSRPE